MPQDEPDYRLVLRPLRSGVPAPIRLRRALKCLLRAFGFRCVWGPEPVTELPPPAQEDDAHGE